MKVPLLSIFCFGAAQIEGDVTWPSNLLSTDASVKISIANAQLKRPELRLFHDNSPVKSHKFVQTNSEHSVTMNFGCENFIQPGEYSVRLYDYSGGPVMYEEKKVIGSYPEYGITFAQPEVSALTGDVMALGSYRLRDLCSSKKFTLSVALERSPETVDSWSEVANAREIYAFPTETLTVSCGKMDLPGRYRIRTDILDERDRAVGNVVYSDVLKVNDNDIYELEIPSVDADTGILRKCDRGDEFLVNYRSPPCANNHRIRFVPKHSSGKQLHSPKIISIRADEISASIPCSWINSASVHGACLEYLDHLDTVRASVCFSLPQRPVPNISGDWAKWSAPKQCYSPCSITDPTDFIMQQSSTEWSFSRRSCTNPTPLGLGSQCSSQSKTATGLMEFDVKNRQLCPSPWDMSEKQQEENCECGCSKVGPNGGFVYSPAPWRCQEKENTLKWDFQCDDCETLLMEVVHLDDEIQEELFFVNHDSSDDLKINGLGRFPHHQAKNASIVYNRNPTVVTCGFAIKISFVQKVDAVQTPTRISMPRQMRGETEEEGPDFALWGILVCVGFLLILVTACVFNFRSDKEEVTAGVVVGKHALDREYQLYSELDRANFQQSPQKIKPNAAAFEIAQQQLRLMKSEGRHEIVAEYPREIFESEKIAREQIPLLFGHSDLKTTSASSLGSDKVEAAPANSNRTEVTHSTNVSDHSQNSIPLRHTSTRRDSRPFSGATGFQADLSSAATSPVRAPQPLNSRAHSDDINAVYF